MKPKKNNPQRSVSSTGSVRAGASAVAFGKDEAEPVAAKVAAPVLLVALLGLLLWWGDMYLMNHGGEFNAQVYHPFTSYKEVVNLHPLDPVGKLREKGQLVYNNNCVACHGPSGEGNAATFVPPLAQSEWVTEPGTGRLIRILSKGLNGPLKVSGKDYGQGVMFAVGDSMPGTEDEKNANIAAVLTFIRSSWGNKAPAVKPEEVSTIRKELEGRTDPFTGEELLKIAP